MKNYCLFLFLLTQLLVVFNTNAQVISAFNPQEKFPADSLRIWTKELMTGIEVGHPGFYRYTTKKQFDRIIDSTTQTIEGSLNTIEYYRKLKPLIAQIGCLHTGVALSEDYSNYLEETYSLLPLQVFIDENKSLFISENLSNNKELQTKSKIISINGKSSAEILRLLLKAIPSDGYNETLKIRLLNYRFASWYQSAIECTNSFEVQVLQNEKLKTFQLKGTSEDRFPTYESISESNKEQLDFKIEDDIAFLKVRSFAKSTIKENGQNYKKYLKNVFKNLKEQNVKKLVIDVRNNTGGTDGNAVLLARYFFDQPFRYWDKIEVTKETAEQITGIHRLFYKKPVKIDSLYRWFKALQTNEFDYYETQDPSKLNFTGEVYILTNGLCMSSCSDFVAILSDNNIAKVIGQETGGGFQGNTSGMMPENPIYGNMIMTIPIQKYTNAVDPKKNFGRGTIPNFKTYPTLEEWITKKDVEMTFIIDYLNKQK